jgi:hypothetical protein
MLRGPDRSRPVPLVRTGPEVGQSPTRSPVVASGRPSAGGATRPRAGRAPRSAGPSAGPPRRPTSACPPATRAFGLGRRWQRALRSRRGWRPAPRLGGRRAGRPLCLVCPGVRPGAPAEPEPTKVGLRLPAARPPGAAGEGRAGVDPSTDDPAHHGIQRAARYPPLRPSPACQRYQTEGHHGSEEVQIRVPRRRGPLRAVDADPDTRRPRVGLASPPERRRACPREGGETPIDHAERRSDDG